jgi:quercetin dioxygenase-like cupin family protein|tara:strand:- start:183 stop:671 length:489 start_codon:yes stop_codon:yes gene_type:complete
MKDKMTGDKVILYKGYIKLNDFDFNLLAEVIDTVNNNSFISSNHMFEKILESCFQIKGVHGHPFFHEIWSNFERLHNPNGQKNSSIDIFFSFCSGGRSIAHSDFEDVCIFGLYGKTIYVINNEEYNVVKGDLLFIPKNTIHRGIGITPRIIGSYGTWPLNKK